MIEQDHHHTTAREMGRHGVAVPGALGLQVEVAARHATAGHAHEYDRRLPGGPVGGPVGAVGGADGGDDEVGDQMVHAGGRHRRHIDLDAVPLHRG
ncbi:unannotated protein [freshwater metagenome]|uniref:Unannotated protein n=1 Tax=freshwater metagenome TaxID=449393 RepID=A0A6J7AJT4_9ZZZZ